MTEAAFAALRFFADAVTVSHGHRLVGLVVFGSRARGDATAESDLDIAVVLSDERIDRLREKMILAGIAYDAIVETGIHVQPWPFGAAEWRNPNENPNPSLVLAARRDGRWVAKVDSADDIQRYRLSEPGVGSH